MSYWIIYLIDVITPLKGPCILLSAFSVILFVFLVFELIEHKENYGKDKDYKRMYRITRGIPTISVIFILLAVFIPSKTTAYTLLGIKLGQVAVSKPEVQNKVDKISKIIDIKLDQYIQEEGSKK